MNESIRTVINGQTLFKEAIVAFHPEKGEEYYSRNPISLSNIHKQQEGHVNGRVYGYLLLDFELPSDWELPGDVIIERSLVINHGVDDGIGQECVQSFISPVLLPEWVNVYNGHLFLQGIAAVVSFATGRSAKTSGSSFGSVEEEKLIPLKKFIVDNSGDHFANIKNAKVVIKTTDGDVQGRFMDFRPVREEMQSVIPPHLAVQMETDNQFLSIILDNDFNFTGIQQTPIYDQNADEILVVQRNGLRQLASLHPIIVRGTGANWRVHKDVLEVWNRQLSVVMSNLWKLPYKDGKKFDYKKCMQAIRMIQLAHNNYKEDFDLSFSMLVAAIESIAQIAMPEPGKHELHYKWKKSTKDDPELRALFEYYCKLRIHEKRLKDRFADFVFKYFPTEQWWNLCDDDILRNGFNSSWESPKDQIRRQTEFSPYHFTPEQLKDIVKDTYNYRSNFVHRGESAPHQKPTQGSWQRFFEEQYNRDKSEKLQAKLHKEDRGLCGDKSTYPYTWTFGEGEKRKTHSVTEPEMFTTKRYLINRDLMREIAIKSISNYLAEQSKVYTALMTA